MVGDGSGTSETRDRTERARQELELAADRADDRDVREQLHTIQQGFAAVLEDEEESGGRPLTDRLKEIEDKLAGLAQETEGEANRHINTAEALIAGYWRELTEE